MYTYIYMVQKAVQTYTSEIYMYYLLTTWSKALLEKLTDFQIVKKFPAFYGTRTFITAVIIARHLSHPETARSSPCLHIPYPEVTT
jgi:hypothetical protein